MEDLKSISNTALVNLLAQKTISYTQMLAGNIKTDEFYNCKQLIERLTTEIKRRKGTGSASADSITRIPRPRNK